MININKKMSSNETSTNVKIFILKLMINEPKVFEPFGKFWFSTVVQFLISGKIKGAALNYFVIDAIVVMLSWSETCIPEVIWMYFLNVDVQIIVLEVLMKNQIVIADSTVQYMAVL